MDIANIAQKHLDSMIENGTIETLVNEQITKSITRIINDAFAEYGDWGKTIKEVITKKMELNLDKLNLHAYNTMVISTIESYLTNTIAENSLEILKNRMNDILKIPEKKEWNLSDIVKLFWKENKGYTSGSPYVKVKKDYGTIWIDIGLNTPSYGQTCVKIALDEKDNKVWYAGNPTTPNPLKERTYNSGLESILMNLWVNQCKINIDVRDVDEVELDCDYED